MRVFSGIQPTGTSHLGNYFGAFANWIKLQNEGHEFFYCIVNQHAITMPQDPVTLQKNSFEMAATFLAVGLDKSALFFQSDVPAHSQLAWVFNCLVPMGQMERMIQFKEKSKDQELSATLGLFAYPVLQAADILVYKADTVPVGIDQAQHLELTRLIAKKFNTQYKEIFPEPKTLHTETMKIVGLDGSAKMSKSKNNYIALNEDEETLWKKISVATTDPARVTKNDPGNPFVCNIYTLHTLFSDKAAIGWVVDGCQKAKIGCIECKKKLFLNINNFLKPIRDQYQYWIERPKELKSFFDAGTKKANAIANETIKEVYDIIGFKPWR